MKDAGAGNRQQHMPLIAIAVGLLSVALLALAFLDDPFVRAQGLWFAMHDIEGLAHSIRDFGNWGVAVSIGLMALHSFIPFPAELVAMANGVIYGPIFGTLITWIGAMLGAQAAFWTARSFGRSVVERYVPAERRARADRWITRNGTLTLLGMRLIPVIAFNLINYVAGLARVRWWTFTWTTAIGILPLTFAMVVAGDRMKNVPLRLVAIVLLGAFVLWIVFKWLRRRTRRQAQRETSR